MSREDDALDKQAWRAVRRAGHAPSAGDIFITSAAFAALFMACALAVFIFRRIEVPIQPLATAASATPAIVAALDGSQMLVVQPVAPTAEPIVAPPTSNPVQTDLERIAAAQQALAEQQSALAATVTALERRTPEPTTAAGSATDTTAPPPLPTRARPRQPTARPRPRPTAAVLTISGTQTWAVAKHIDRDVVVPKGATLIINPGVEMTIDKGVAIYVDGQLEARGNPQATVRFVATLSDNGPVRPSWRGIFGNANSTIQLDNVEIRGAGAGGTMLTSAEGSLVIRHGHFVGNGGQISTRDSWLEVRDTEITGNDIPYGAVISALYTLPGGLAVTGSRISSNLMPDGIPGIAITSQEAVASISLQLEGNIVINSTGPNVALAVAALAQGSISCNILQGGEQGLSLRAQLPQVPPPALTVQNNAITGHTPVISEQAYLKYGLGRGATSAIALTMHDNWWGDPSGPYHPETNQLGRGDAVGNNIEYSNWLPAPPACANALQHQ